MSKKRSTRNTKKTLKALKQKRVKFSKGDKANLRDTDVHQKAKQSETSLMGRIGEFFRAGDDGRNFVDNTFGRAADVFRGDTGNRGIYEQTDANIASNDRGIYAQTDANIASNESTPAPRGEARFTGRIGADGLPEQTTTPERTYSEAGRQALAQRQAGMGNVTTGNVSMSGRRGTRGYQEQQGEPQRGPGSDTGGQQQQPTSTASTVQPVVTNPAGEGAGTMTTSQSTRYVNNKLVKGAPSISIDAESPDAPTASTVSELAVDSNYLTNAAKTKAGLSTIVQELDDPEDVKTTKATAGKATTVSAVLSKATTPADFEAAGYTSVQAKELAATKAAEGSLSPEAIAKVTEVDDLSERAVGQTTTAAQKRSTLAKESDFKIDPAAFVAEVTGKTAAVSPTKDAEAKTRRAILGNAAEDGQAAKIIDTVGYDAAQRRTVTGSSR